MKKYKKKELGLTALILLGTGFALTVIVLISFVLAIISSFTKNPTALTGAFSLLTLILAGLTSGFVTSKVNGDSGVLIGSLSSAIATALILAVGLIWKGGALNPGVMLNVLSFFGVSVISAILGKKRIKTAHRRYR